MEAVHKVNASVKASPGYFSAARPSSVYPTVIVWPGTSPSIIRSFGSKNLFETKAALMFSFLATSSTTNPRSLARDMAIEGNEMLWQETHPDFLKKMGPVFPSSGRLLRMALRITSDEGWASDGTTSHVII